MKLAFERLGDLASGTMFRRLKDMVGYCALPAASYHVTVADLINDGNIAKAAELGACAPLDASYPKGMSCVRDVLEPVVERSGILNVPPIKYCLTGLNTFGGRVIAARFVALEESTEAYGQLVAARERVADGLKRWNLPLSPFKPHLTLGYFAFPPVENRVDVHIRKLSAEFTEEFRSIEFDFGTPVMMTFSSMAEFRRE